MNSSTYLPQQHHGTTLPTHSFGPAVDDSWDSLRWELDEVRDAGDFVLGLGHIRGRGRGTGATIDTSAQLRGLTVMGADCYIGAGAILEDTIVWPGAQIASLSELQDCIVRTRQRAEGILQNAIV